MYTVCGEISSWINHLMYSCLWNPFHMPEGFMTEATRSDIPRASPPPSPRLFAGRNDETTRTCTNTDFTHMPLTSQQVSKWDDKIRSHLGYTIKICNSAEPQTSTRLRLCFGNRISPWRGMNVQMCYRWDSLNWDLAHWYSLCTITVLQNRGAEKC